MTTDAEFHDSARSNRLRSRTDVVKVAGRPVESVAEQMAEAIDERAACALISVYYERRRSSPARHRRARVPVVAPRPSSAFCHLNVVPFGCGRWGFGRVRPEAASCVSTRRGNCFRGCRRGWAAPGAHRLVRRVRRREEAGVGEVRYGDGAARLAGATYDPTSHYRAAAVFEFHVEMGLTPQLLREVSRHQVGVLIQAFDALDADPALARVEPIPGERRGGFLAIRSPRARALSEALRARGVHTDARGNFLRFGPAPYLSDEQLADAMARLGDVLRGAR